MNYFLFLIVATLATLNGIKADFNYTLVDSDDGVLLTITRDEIVILNGLLGIDQHHKPINPNVISNITATPDGLEISWQSNNTADTFRDCFKLNSNDTNWFGGPERYNQVWPLEKMSINYNEKPWVLLRSDNFAVIEPYWLNSKGVYLYVSEKTPLYIDQNNLEPDTVCFIANVTDKYVNRERVLLSYSIVVKDTPKEAHLHAVENHLGKAKAHPNENMIRHPVWTTWAKYKAPISDDIVLSFANDIANHGYAGQLEIDDNWEKCYGAQEFDTEKFGKINETVKALHDLNFKVTLWVHPFVNDDCDPNKQTGLDKGYFVKNSNGDTFASWWNSNNAHQIDFTNEEARSWVSERLNKLKELHGIDGFKFDAGETDYVNQPAVYPSADIELVPNIHSKEYLKLCASFGDLIEVRSAWRTQELPIFVRMLDKDSRWGTDNGLKSLITTLLQMNMIGYVMVLPDMIGGNGYQGPPDAELLVRWAQANTFMPSMQFSYLPWDITSDDFDSVAIVKKFVDLHEQYADEILKAMNASIERGVPVNAPIWWIDPLNTDAHKVDDEYLLGEKILVAPIIKQGATSRNIYLPIGHWKDGNTDESHIGPKTIENYSAPIDILPYFVRHNV